MASRVAWAISGPVSGDFRHPASAPQPPRPAHAAAGRKGTPRRERQKTPLPHRPCDHKTLYTSTVKDMRNEILRLKDLGRMPDESGNDPDSIDELINTYDVLLEQIQLPISFDEAMVLVKIFPENAFYDLQWSLLRLVESVCVDDDNKYIQLINSCPSQEWRDALNTRHANYQKAQKVKK